MNKDVVYIEPEEDITDIITKIENSKSKIVALVPPKKAGVFRSIVNIKLITKAGTSSKKTVVLVTTDPSIIKLAAATKMPVTKDLQTAPEIPDADTEIDETEVVDVEDDAEEIEEKDSKKDEDKKTDEDSDDEDSDDEEDEEKESKKDSKAKDDEDEDEDEDDDDDESEEEEKEEKKSRKGANKKSTKKDFSLNNKEERKGKLANSNNPVLKWIGTHKKITAGIGVGLVFLIILGIFAFGVIPAVTVTLKLETTTGNFSENVTFTETLTEENISEGKFYIEEKKLENKAEVEFEATGKKNAGEKASGRIKVTHYFPLDEEGGTVPINNGTTFTNSGLTYVVTSGANISWDGDLGAVTNDCENNGTAGWRSKGCAVSATVTVTATEPGAKYNISSTSSGWSPSIGGLDIITNEAMSGGSDKTVTIVQQSDTDEAMKKIATENESTNKEKLLATLSDDSFAISSSFKQTTSDPVSSPKVNEEVEDGKKAKLTVTTTDTIFVIDETKLKEFIAEKAKLQEGYKIYEMNDPFIENFLKVDSGYAGKLKTSYTSGSTITENDVVETVKGKGIGTAKRDLSDNFKGIKTITIDTSAPWVTSVPNNTEKITIKIETEG